MLIVHVDSSVHVMCLFCAMEIELNRCDIFLKYAIICYYIVSNLINLQLGPITYYYILYKM